MSNVNKKSKRYSKCICMPNTNIPVSDDIQIVGQEPPGEVKSITNVIEIEVESPMWSGVYAIGTEDNALYIYDGKHKLQFTKEVWSTLRTELDKLCD